MDKFDLILISKVAFGSKKARAGRGQTQIKQASTLNCTNLNDKTQQQR